MSWMNASAVAAAGRRNAAQSAWDHSVESPDGYGRRNVEMPTCTAAPAASDWRPMTAEELKAAADKAAAEETEMLAAMLASGEY